MCILIFFTSYTGNISILRRVKKDTVINVNTFSCKYPLFFPILIKIESL